MTTSFTCPRCLKDSANPQDIQAGYCGHCHMRPRRVVLDLPEWRVAVVILEAEAGYVSEPLKVTLTNIVREIREQAL